jgi:catechol 2,3-dioxygenase-like lactoylglutathione lyase family enzyme
MPNPLASRDALVFSHLGFYVRDIERMARFYRDALGFFETDRGLLGPVQLVFLSRDPNEHHQIVLASGRPEGPGFNLINQISLRVPDLAVLREVRRRALAEPAVSELVAVTHGNAVSIYFRDPEGNRLEVFMDTPWYCEQPLREPIDLDRPDAEVLAQAETLARTRPGFRSRNEWRADMEKMMGYRS